MRVYPNFGEGGLGKLMVKLKKRKSEAIAPSGAKHKKKLFLIFKAKKLAQLTLPTEKVTECHF